MSDRLLSKTLCQWLKCSAAVEAVEPQPNLGSSGSAGNYRVSLCRDLISEPGWPSLGGLDVAEGLTYQNCLALE